MAFGVEVGRNQSSRKAKRKKGWEVGNETACTECPLFISPILQTQTCLNAAYAIEHILKLFENIFLNVEAVITKVVVLELGVLHAIIIMSIYLSSENVVGIISTSRCRLFFFWIHMGRGKR